MSAPLWRAARNKQIVLPGLSSGGFTLLDHRPVGPSWVNYMSRQGFVGMPTIYPPPGYPNVVDDKFVPIEMIVVESIGGNIAHEVITDLTAPYGAGSVYAQKYPGATTYNGSGIGNWRSYNAFAEVQPLAPHWRECYIETVMGLFGSGGDKYRFATAGQEKFLYTGTHNLIPNPDLGWTSHKGSMPIGLDYSLDGRGPTDGICGFDMTVQSEGPLGTYVLGQNGPGRFYTDRYNKVAFYFRTSDIDASNGIIKMWVTNSGSVLDPGHNGLCLEYYNWASTNIPGNQLFIDGIMWETVRNGPGDLTAPGGQSRRFNTLHADFSTS